MSDIAIRCEKLGKRYRIGQREPYLALRDVLTHAATAPLRLFQASVTEASNNGTRHIWALKDASFQVCEGEVVGIIGRNGAGKSTLLKILARVTKPTEGFAKIHGRLGSLLEVGTGFHPELSGRENTYLSGAILGMRRREIARKFDEIVAFAEVEKFIDMPLKHYSTGMQMRLAFAVAAHLEPEILLVDEVLAVGDAAFQKKCLGKMSEVSHGGRTILFVSHNMAAVHTLCARALLLRDGRMIFDGPTLAATSQYYADALGGMNNGSDLRGVRRTGTRKAAFSSIVIEPRDSTGERLTAARPGCDLAIEVEIESRVAIPDSNVAVIIHDMTGYRLIDVNTAQKGEFLSLEGGQKARVRFQLRELLLKPGRYSVGLWLGRHYIEEIDSVETATTFDVVEGPESMKHVVVFPGPYLCRFESKSKVTGVTE